MDLNPQCFEATKEEADKARETLVKFDKNGEVGDRVIDFTPEEKAAIAAQEQAAIDEYNLKIEKIIQKFKAIGLDDEEINIILSR